MNLGAVASLTLRPERNTWYRAVDPRYLPTALSTAHTPRIPSRFSPGPLATRPFEILYLAESHMVALFEVGALFGSPTVPGGTVPHPAGSWTVIPVQVQLSNVADLTNVSEQGRLDTNVQELTGDWRGYQLRGPGTSVSLPTGTAPTQELGEALKARWKAGASTLRDLVPCRRNCRTTRCLASSRRTSEREALQG